MFKSVVFARFKPWQKAEVIKKLKSIGLKVGMIGDGSNDSLAIRESDLGISFTSADASFSAPFSSKSTSLQCVK